ncbi:NAD-dependent epimerase/dehydratase family protein [Methyloceanibacter marginalis]|uniref:NAD-dependent epimerase/dehydratase family protein n=1 Tax=Methyloceanibacter marginalis TaxID=1774971 RepID=UPI000A838036|nr:NAD-dependent epimerase/dehydratase family protein [Methyloceanibacter marginalis]
MRDDGYEATQFTGDRRNSDLPRLLQGTTHLLHSIPPGRRRSRARQLSQRDRQTRHLEWIGYLSTVGVYGDQHGSWVSEETVPKPNSPRTEARVQAEQAWLDFGEEIGVPVHVFRLAGIYGPGRSVFDKLAEGTARRINKDGQVFSRVHVEDIARVLEASIARRARARSTTSPTTSRPHPGDVVAHAAKMMGVEPPPEIDFEDADLSPMARTFYQGSRRIGNALIKSELGVELRYPTFREGLVSLMPRETADR